jgi:hypothetical protein
MDWLKKHWWLVAGAVVLYMVNQTRVNDGGSNPTHAWDVAFKQFFSNLHAPQL